MPTVSSGQITIIDMNDAKQLISYIGSSQSKTVIFNPNNNEYVPNYATNNQVLTPQLFVAGTSTDVSAQAKSIKWFYQTNGTGALTEIKASDTNYVLGTGAVKTLTIKSNVLASNLSMTYICETVFTDTTTGFDVTAKAEIELVKVQNGIKGTDGKTPVKGTDYFDGQKGADGKSSYLWIRYSQNANGNPMVEDPTNAKYIGTATTETASAPTSYTNYKWALIKGTDGIKGADGADGRSSYLHIKYSNDGGLTFTGNNGEDVGKWIGTYIDFTAADSNNVSDYTWNKVAGEDGKDGLDAVLASVWTPDGNTIKNSEGSLKATVTVYKGTSEVAPTAFKWYIQDPSATTGTGGGGDADGGNGWRLLNATYNAGTTGYATKTLTIPASAISSVESFLCVVTYGGKKYKDVCTVIDTTDPIVVSIIGLSTFKNGQGTSEYTAKLYRNGEEIDLTGTGYTYKWYLYNSDNVLISGFSKTGKTITVNSTDFVARANLVCEVIK